eukprot:scaffold2658_cov51-Phaeocystis_antarctica.AAC.5
MRGYGVRRRGYIHRGLRGGDMKVPRCLAAPSPTRNSRRQNERGATAERVSSCRAGLGGCSAR